MSRVNNHGCIEKMRTQEPFVNNSNALMGSRSLHGWGQMPGSEIGPANDPYLREGVVFWVYSYDTPIAWIWDNSDVEMPHVWLGERSAYHQLLTAYALDVDFKWPETAPQLAPIPA